MRNLKKVLSLVLALMMVLSVMVTASAADFADAESINYKEAVDVLAAAGVLNGVDNGDGTYSFLPTETLNREAAAKMVAYIKLGGSVPAATADALVNPFADVNGWSTNWIKYCYSEGIVNGVNATSFLPKDYLTGYAYAKMLLVAAGIDGEYTGGQWKVNVYTAAKEAGLLAGLESVVLSSNLTREQAAQMTLNALDAVAKATGGKWVAVVDGQQIEIAADDVPLYKLAGVVVKYVPNTASATGFGSALKLNRVETVNDAGLNIHYWTVKGEKATVDYVDDVKVASFAAGTTYKALLADLGYTKDSLQGASWYANGVEKSTYTNVELVALLKSTTKIPAPVDVYVDGDGNYKLMATIEYVATAKCIDDKADKTTGLYTYTFTVKTLGGTYEVDVEGAKDAYSKDAAYLVVPQGDNTSATKLLSIEEIAPVTVTVTAKGSNYVRAGSDKYTVAVGLDASKVLAGVSVTKDYNLYLASDNSVIWVEKYVPAGEVVDTTETLVYLTAVWSETVKGTEGTTDKWGNVTEGEKSVTTYYAQGVDVDGEIVDVVISEENFKDATILNKLWNVVYNKTTKVNDLKVPTTAIVTNKLAEKKISFKVDTNTYYYNTAEYVHVIGSKDKLSVTAGSLAEAVKAGSAWVIFTGEKTNKTVSTVIYWSEKASVNVPDPTYTYDMFVAEDSVSTDETFVSYVPTGKEEAVNESVWVHTVLIDGEEVEILYNSDTIKAGFYGYYEGAYGYYILKSVEGTTAKVDNVYGAYVTIDGVWADKDITGIEITDLTEKPDNTVDAGDTIAFYTITNADGSTTVARIYILASGK